MTNCCNVLSIER